ncbi:response regulator transcription factor [candidate division KSB1 bacterium]|nr:response regulator transcription factor [candidate division KSB1 bacterium]
MQKILLIEDEAGIAQMISVQLQLVGFKVEAVADTKSALHAERMKEADIIVLDWMLPDAEGPSIIPKIRLLTKAPILMLTARSEIVDKLVGFEAGADDYLTKPFDMMELIARIKALLRRAADAAPKSKHAPLRYGEIAMDLETRKVEVAEEEIELTPTEFKILEIMMQSPSTVFSRDRLIELVLGYEYEGYGRTLDSHIARLRSKIESDPKNPEYLKTVFGVGYKFGK